MTEVFTFNVPASEAFCELNFLSMCWLAAVPKLEKARQGRRRASGSGRGVGSTTSSEEGLCRCVREGGIAVAQLCRSPLSRPLWQRQEVISCSENPEGNLGEARVRISPLTIEHDV